MKLEFRELGAGEPIVILHGLFGSSRNWMSIARELSVVNRILALDLPNHGGSSWMEEMSYESLSGIIAEFMVENDLKGATVLGHSLGGKVAMNLALTEPELIGRLIVVDIAPVEYDHDNLSIINALESINLTMVKTRSDADGYLKRNITQQILRSFLLQNLVFIEGKYEWRINIPIIKANLEKIQGFPSFAYNIFFDGPTLFIAGADSKFIESSHYNKISRLFPKASVKKIADADHWLHADNPKAFLQAVNQFI
jgi:pimeloyl-ACP methyl ester carboxylesterase